MKTEVDLAIEAVDGVNPMPEWKPMYNAIKAGRVLAREVEKLKREAFWLKATQHPLLKESKDV